MKKNAKMTTTKMKLETRISARVPNALYVAAKFVASCQGITMEEKIAELLKKDLAYVTNQKWFVDMVQSEEAGDMAYILNLFKKKTGGSDQAGDDQFGSNWGQ